MSRAADTLVRWCRRAAGAGLVATLLASGPAFAGDADWTWRGVPKVVAFADVHGAYVELTGLLQAAGVIDRQRHWQAGATHVVSLGDLLDRGADSRQVMDLLMRLQDEAAAAGGALHVVLGNHEAMNLLGDRRYVAAGEYAAFAAEEPAGVRERERAGWLAAHGPGSAAGFDARFPPGYFGYRAALAPDGKYGRWLLGLPVIIVIDGTVYMHGGPSSLLARLSPAAINQRYHAALAGYLDALSAVQASGLVREEDVFAQRPALAAARLAALPADDNGPAMRLAADVQRFTAAAADPLLSVDGPTWYRGAALCNACAETDVLLPVLAGLGARRLVVGHTTVHDARVVTRLDGRVVKLDAGMNVAAYGGRPAALITQRESLEVLYGDTLEQSAALPPEPLYVAPGTVDDAAVAGILSSGTATAAGPQAPGMLNVVVSKDGRSVPAVFVAAPPDAVRRELAAYRLDRLLQLGLVPATAAAVLQGQDGYLQARPARWLGEADASPAAGIRRGWCAIGPQQELLRALDALAGRERSGAEGVLYDADEWTLLASGYAGAFRAGPVKATAAPGPEMRRRLEALDAARLQQALGDTLTGRERGAILARRDAMLQRTAGAAAAH